MWSRAKNTLHPGAAARRAAESELSDTEVSADTQRRYAAEFELSRFPPNLKFKYLQSEMDEPQADSASLGSRSLANQSTVVLSNWGNCDDEIA